MAYEYTNPSQWQIRGSGATCLDRDINEVEARIAAAVATTGRKIVRATTEIATGELADKRFLHRTDKDPA